MSTSSNHDTMQGRGAADGACEFTNVQGAAKVLGVSTSFLNKERVTGGGPPFVKFGASVRYYIPALLAWATAQTRRSTSDREVA